MKHFSILIIFVFLIALIATAQNPTATLVGTVQDGSNAVIPGATVVERNIANNLRWTGVSGHAGEFTIPNLQPGQYTATVDTVSKETRATVNLWGDDVIRASGRWRPAPLDGLKITIPNGASERKQARSAI